MWHIKPSLLLLATCLGLHWPAASADVRMEESAEDGILITNLPDDVHMQAASGADVPATATTSRLPFDDVVKAAAHRHHLDPALLHAVIAAESGHNPRAISARGAQGLMQLMPATARHLNVTDPYNPALNIDAGALYLRQLHDMFQGDLTLALAAYNAGPGAVLKHGRRIPPYAETRRYVPAVLAKYRELNGLAKKRVSRTRG